MWVWRQMRWKWEKWKISIHHAKVEGWHIKPLLSRNYNLAKLLNIEYQKDVE